MWAEAGRRTKRVCRTLTSDLFLDTVDLCDCDLATEVTV